MGRVELRRYDKIMRSVVVVMKAIFRDSINKEIKS